MTFYAVVVAFGFHNVFKVTTKNPIVIQTRNLTELRCLARSHEGDFFD